jgi:hypothetical protein
VLTQLVSCESTRVPQGTNEFWQGISRDRANQPNFPPQRFLTKAILIARMSGQRLTKWWVGLKMDLKNFDLIFCPSTPSRQKVNATF